MKLNRKTLQLQRRAIDEKLIPLIPLSQVQSPRLGWIKAIRESLLMTTRQLAERMGISQVTVTEMEKREVAKTITLETLERAARALNCNLVYALIPKATSLENTLTQQAVFAATTLGKATLHSMKLEDQGVSSDESAAQIKQQAEELKQKADRRIWGTLPIASRKKNK